MRPIWILLCAVLACDSPSDVDGLSLRVVSGDNQVGGVGARLPQPIVVQVLDGAEPARNVEVTWQVAAGGGTVDSARATTDANGQATAVWTLGRDIGMQSLSVTAGLQSTNIRANGEFQVASVSAGYRHTCALSSSGLAYCWGLNQAAQLGDGTNITRVTPVPVITPIRFRQITAGYSHTCGVSISDEGFCWGENRARQLGANYEGMLIGTPMALTSTSGFLDMSAGYVHTCGVTLNGNVECWGANDLGQLSGTDANRGLVTGQQFRQVSAGEFHTCALRADGVIMCWGMNTSGELGNGSFGSVVRTPTPVAGDLRFVNVSAGVRHTCATSTTGTLYCWGRNAAGETGQAPLFSATSPAPVPQGTGFMAVSTGNTHTCALRAGAVFCMGSVVGSAIAPTQSPTQVPSLPTATMLSSGFEHTCAVVARASGALGGDVWCWGSTGVTSSTTPARVQF